MFHVINNVLKDNGPVHVENFIKCLHVPHRRTVSVKASSQSVGFRIFNNFAFGDQG